MKLLKKYKRYAVLLVMTVAIFLLTGLDTSKFFTTMETALQAVLTLIGAGVAVFGVVHLIESQSSHDPNQKSAGIKELAAGLGIIVVGNLLVPVFVSMAKDAMNSTTTTTTTPP